MKNKNEPIFVGEIPLTQKTREISGEFLELFGDLFYKIQNYDQMPPFFISLVSSSNHWFFISSTGGLTAGRVNPEQALFPYYTEDKINENFENTGSKTIFLVKRGAKTFLWEPFSIRQQGEYQIHRNIYKDISGTTLIFEEVNDDLRLKYRYAWRTSDRFGFIKSSWLENTGEICHVEFLDGIQNILPAYAPLQVQNTTSCLLDAYKRSELDSESGLAIFALNATLTDLPEPSESLLVTTVFQVGLDNADYLLSSTQLDGFRKGQAITPEIKTRGKRGAFFAHTELALVPGRQSSWHIAADVSQDFAQIVNTKNLLQNDLGFLAADIERDIAENQANLVGIVAHADGLQLSAKKPTTAHHFANVMFNVMRGGIFYDQYWVDKDGFLDFVSSHNKVLLDAQSDFFSSLPERIHMSALQSRAEESGDADLIRLSYTYLPLFFSRRHGDPSRPWNMFSINLKDDNGADRLDYQGNWRDIFQNWEALAWSYPEFVEGMIFTFLNATTADGYNPYRITLEGIDWEVPEPENPWSNIGYWSDHQIIYLLKLMELSAKVHPGKLNNKMDQAIFSFANVPYRIKPHKDLMDDPYHTILFDDALEAEIDAAVAMFGTDRRLVCDDEGKVLHRTLLEKLLSLLLAKLVNFVPEGGLWMNTQRPEWNDANNALVGKGLSVVTLGYLYRFILFLIELISEASNSEFKVSTEIENQFSKIAGIFTDNKHHLRDSFDDQARFRILTELSKSGSDYREGFYDQGFSGEFSIIQGRDLLAFLELVRDYLAHSLRKNHRVDDLYHTYNVIQFADKGIGIKHLDVMLEGQVSILSSGILSGGQALALLESLRKSPLYVEEQKTYILYPDKKLPGFLEKNSITSEQVGDLDLPAKLAEAKDRSLLVKDKTGTYHFSGSIHNERDVKQALQRLQQDPQYKAIIEAEEEKIVDLFESVFHHSEFTGRSSTFFAYEGLGSVYWHMVSKLLLAVQENVFGCTDETTTSKLVEKYRDIQAGLGFNKTPEAYGAFPTDPYSHTPKGQGARQPGMTGLVKEEIIARQGELSLTIEDGCLVFNPILVDESELLSTQTHFTYIDVNGGTELIDLPVNALAYTLCQTPIILQAGNEQAIIAETKDGQVISLPGNRLDKDLSQHIFKRDGRVKNLVVQFVLG
jgi:hypothetical protein